MNKIADSPVHTCWASDDFDGTLSPECAACLLAARYPCDWCGYGHVFPTHNPIAHADNGDAMAPHEDDWDDDLLNQPYSWEKVAWWQHQKGKVKR